MADDLDDLEGPPGVGHNSGEADEAETDSITTTLAVSELRQLIERVERLEAEKKDIANDIKEIYSEAKGRGFDTKAMRAVVRARAMDQAKPMAVMTPTRCHSGLNAATAQNSPTPR